MKALKTFIKLSRQIYSTEAVFLNLLEFPKNSKLVVQIHTCKKRTRSCSRPPVEKHWECIFSFLVRYTSQIGKVYFLLLVDGIDMIFFLFPFFLRHRICEWWGWDVGRLRRRRRWRKGKWQWLQWRHAFSGLLHYAILPNAFFAFR